GDGGLPSKKIALDLQLADLAVQIVDHLLRIFDRRRLATVCKQFARALRQLLFPVADHRRMNPKLRRQLRQGLFPRQRCHRHSRLEFRAVLLPLYAHVSRPLDRSALSLSRCPKSGAAAFIPLPKRVSRRSASCIRKTFRRMGREDFINGLLRRHALPDELPDGDGCSNSPMLWVL